MHFDEDPDAPEFRGPSKSQRKREATALQTLGEQLVKLTPAQLQKIPLPDALLEAVQVAQNTPQRGAHRRQLQYIGKLMRQFDPDQIRQALAALETTAAAARRQQHRLEQLCAALVAGDEATLADFLNQHPAGDSHYVRQLVRTAVREQAQDKPPAARRALFRYLRELTANTD